MVDPFLMLMCLNRLGPHDIVPDHSADIRFVQPGRGTVRAEFRLDVADLDAVRTATADGDKHLRTHPVEVLDEAGDGVARLERTVYVRRKERARPPSD